MTSGPGPKRIVIVVGIDGSETSIHAGAYAAGMAQRMDGLLVVVYVHTVGGLGVSAPGVVPLMQETQHDIAADLRRQLDEATSLAPLEPEFLERTGNPFKEIVAVATERRADAVVVGASMQAGHKLVGSLAVHLVRAAQWPVTVVP